MSVLFYLDNISFVWFCLLHVLYLSGQITSSKSVETLKRRLDKVRTWHFNIFWSILALHLVDRISALGGPVIRLRCCFSGGRERCKAGTLNWMRSHRSTLWCHQTWLAGNSPNSMEVSSLLARKITDFLWFIFFSHRSDPKFMRDNTSHGWPSNRIEHHDDVILAPD